jgi:hypothetical protein
MWVKPRERFHAPFCRWVLKTRPENWRAGDNTEPLDGESCSPCKVCDPPHAAAAACTDPEDA